MTTTPGAGSRAAPEGPDRPQSQGAQGTQGTKTPTVLPPGGKRRRGPWGWWTRLSRRRKWALVALLTVPVLIVVAAAGIFYVTTKVPLPQSIDTAEVSTVTYRDGKTVLFKIGSINRTNVALSAVSLDAQHAVLAAEDKNFYSESGISYTGIARALWADVRGHEILQGGSTITQQYVKNAYLTSERSFTRKLKEIVIAIKLAHKYSKDQILDYYLNTIYFGRGAYGIEAAAQSYFGIPAAKLTAAQGVVLAGLIRAPSVLDPRVNPVAAKTRFHEVVQAMASKNWLTAAQAKALTVPATLAVRTTGPNAVKSPQDAYIRDEVLSELESHGVSEDEINRGGLQITTTLDPVAQQAAVASVNATFSSTPADVQPALVAIQPGTGEVRAWYGGRFYGKGTGGFSDFVDNVTDPVQPGSSFKPIALAAALKAGISLNSYYKRKRPPGDHAGLPARGAQLRRREPGPDQSFAGNGAVGEQRLRLAGTGHRRAESDRHGPRARDSAGRETPCGGCPAARSSCYQPAQHDRRLCHVRGAGRTGPGASGGQGRRPQRQGALSGIHEDHAGADGGPGRRRDLRAAPALRLRHCRGALARPSRGGKDGDDR